MCLPDFCEFVIQKETNIIIGKVFVVQSQASENSSDFSGIEGHLEVRFRATGDKEQKRNVFVGGDVRERADQAGLCVTVITLVQAIDQHQEQWITI